MTRRQFSAIISALPLCGTVIAAAQREEAKPKYELRLYLEVETIALLAMNGSFSLSMMEDYTLPRRNSGRGTEIQTLQGGSNLSELAGINQSVDNTPVGYFNGIPTYILRPDHPSSWSNGGWQFAMERRENGKVKYRTDADMAPDSPTPKTILDQAASTTFYLKDRIQLFQIDNV